MRISRTSRIGLALAIAIAVPSGVAVAVSVGDDPGEPVGTQGQHLADVVSPRSPEAEQGAGLEGRFSVLAKPASDRSALGAAAEYTHSADVMRAQAIPLTPAGRAMESQWQAWIAPGAAPGEICVLAIEPPAVGAGAGCDPLANAAEGKLTMTFGSLQDGPVVVLGVMPDGVDEVTLTMEDGSSRQLRVVDNAYRADVTAPTRSISFTLPGDRQLTTVDVLAYDG